MKEYKLERNLATRFSARNLFEKLLSNKTVILDFSDVKLISRSFANELIRLEKKENFQFRKINLSEEIKMILENADKELDSNILTKNAYDTVSVEKYSSLI